MFEKVVLQKKKMKLKLTCVADGFFFFNFAKMEDSLSGKGGISSRTVARTSCDVIELN